jgi:hypothetical protein
MKKVILCMLALAICGASSIALAQKADDGDSGARASTPPASQLLVARYLVTYLKSHTDPPRSATVVTVINQSSASCSVQVDWFVGFGPDTPVCTTVTNIDSGVANDFCSRNLLSNITSCNTVCSPELTSSEGKAVVSSTCGAIGVDSRVYYTTGASSDTGVAAVSNPKIVRVGTGNRGD